MNILLTGSSGFLGQEVLRELVDHPKVTSIQLLGRTSPQKIPKKCHFTQLDLSNPSELNQLQLSKCNAAIHLAGLYDFNKGYEEHYLHNVLATHNLVRILKKQNIPLFFASTYAVGFQGKSLDESPLKEIPSRANVYAMTKAISETVVWNSGLNGRIFRLGILVGDSERGRIRKIDGPYLVMSLLQRIKKLRGIRYFPLLANGKTILPLVPVDIAAKAITSQIHQNNQMKILGVFRPDSISTSKLFTKMLRRHWKAARPIFFSFAPKRILKIQKHATKIPQGVFQFSMNPIQLSNPHFKTDLGEDFVPPFSKYEEAFFRGFDTFIEETHS